MIYRYMYGGYAQEAVTYKSTFNPSVKRCCLCQFRDMLFLYFETTEKDLPPTKVIDGKTRAFPDGSDWWFMPDLYHYSKPTSEEHWERQIKNKTAFCRLNRLKHEMVGSYAFYHHQLQEEYPADGDKYGMIGLFNDYIFFYAENPGEPDLNPPPGELTTKNTPRDTWNEKMTTHFQHWEDCEEEWRLIDTLIFY